MAASISNHGIYSLRLRSLCYLAGTAALLISLSGCTSSGQLPPWPTAASAPGLVHALLGHSLWVNSVDWSPDGKFIASGSGDTSLVIWDASSGKEVTSINFERGSVTSVAWSPDGKYLATGHAEPSDTVRVWDVASIATGTNNTNRRPVHTMSPTGSVKKLEWSRDGSSLAVGLGFVNPNTGAGMIKSGIAVYDTATGGLAAMLPYPDDVIDVTWSPDHKQLAFRVTDSNITLEDPAGGGRVVVWTLPDSSAITMLDALGGASDLDWSPDGKLLAVGDKGELKLLDTTTWKEVAVLTRYADGAGHVSWSPDGKSLAVGGSPAVEVWDVQGRKLTHTFPHSDAVNSIAWSPDSRFLVTGSEDHYVRIWTVK